MHEVTASIEFQMSLLLFVALGGYLVASRIGQPAVVGEILVGIVIGPSVLSWITYTNFVSSMAHLGAIILLFVTGLEFKLKDVMRWRYGVIAVTGHRVWHGAPRGDCHDRRSAGSKQRYHRPAELYRLGADGSVNDAGHAFGFAQLAVPF